MTFTSVSKIIRICLPSHLDTLDMSSSIQRELNLEPQFFSPVKNLNPLKIHHFPPQKPGRTCHANLTPANYWMKPFFFVAPRETLSSYCWSPDWSPTDCCFFAPAAPGQFSEAATVRCFVKVATCLAFDDSPIIFFWVIGVGEKAHLILTKNKRIVSWKKTWRPCDGTVSICVTEQRNSEYFGGLVVKYMTHTEGTYIDLCQKFLQIALSDLFLC